MGFCRHCSSVVNYLAVVRRLFWQLGQIVVAVAFVERWPLCRDWGINITQVSLHVNNVNNALLSLFRVTIISS